MVERFMSFVGKLVGIGILLGVVLGLGMLTLALAGCSPVPSRLYFVRTLAGNYCVEASSYALRDGCAVFYNGIVAFPQKYQVAVFCSIVNVEPTTRDRCIMPPPTAPAPEAP